MIRARLAPAAGNRLNPLWALLKGQEGGEERPRSAVKW
jgi:hypothetical protein